MNNRLKSAIVSGIIQGVLGYALVTTLAVSISHQADRRLTTVNIAPEVAPSPPPIRPKMARTPPAHAVAVPLAGRPILLHDWAATGPAQRNLDSIRARKWVEDNLPEEDRRLARWRQELPQGSGPARVTRLRPPNLTTHTVYWPATWSKGPLPIIAWGNGYLGKCSNSSLPYAAFLSEIASHGYFVVAVGNDDIDYPQPEGLEILADGRPLSTRASALTKAVDWAIAESSRAGSPYAGKLDTGKIAYMGHDCGAGQALAASSDQRTTTTVLLSAAARFAPNSSEVRRAPIALFAGQRDDASALDAGNANFARAQAAGWPIFKTALKGMNHDGAYRQPDRRWSKAVIGWLDWQLKGEGNAAILSRNLERDGWNPVDAIGL